MSKKNIDRNRRISLKIISSKTNKSKLNKNKINKLNRVRTRKNIYKKGSASKYNYTSNHALTYRKKNNYKYQYKKGGIKTSSNIGIKSKTGSKNCNCNSESNDLEDSTLITELYDINDKLKRLIINVSGNVSTGNPISFIKNKALRVVNGIKDKVTYPFVFVKNTVMLKVNKTLKDQLDLDLTKKDDMERKIAEIDNSIQNNPIIKRKVQNIIINIGKPLEELLEKLKNKVLELENKVIVKAATSGRDATINVINGIPLFGSLVSIAKIIDNVLSILIKMTSNAEGSATKTYKNAASIGKTIGVALGNVVEGIPGIGEIISLIKVIGNLLDITNTLTESVNNITSDTKDNLTNVMNAITPLKDVVNNM